MFYDKYFIEGKKQIDDICKFLKVPFKEKAMELIDIKIKHF